MKTFDKAAFGVGLLVIAFILSVTIGPRYSEATGYRPKAAIQTVEITASGGAPIPASFDNGDSQSLIQQTASNCQNLKVISTIAARCYLKFSDSNATPSDVVDGSHVIGPNSIDYADNLLIKKFWFLRCTGGPTTGDFVVECF